MQRLGQLGHAGRGVELGGRPVEFVRQIIVAIAAAAGKGLCGIDIRVAQRRLIGLARRHQAALGKGVVDAPPDTRTLRGGRGEVQRRGGAGRIEQPLLMIVGGRGGQSSPVAVRDLMMRHAPGIDRRQPVRPAPLSPDRQRQHLALRHLHRQQEPHFPARLVQQVVDAVPRLGQRGRAVGEGGRARIDLIEILQHPQRDAAIDDIFALVARIIPAAGHVELIGAARPDRACQIGALEAGHDLLRMTRRARPLGPRHSVRRSRSRRAAGRRN